MKDLVVLISNEFKLEFRRKSTLIGLALFALATVYLCYQAFQQLEDVNVWNALLWIIVAFTAFNAIGKSFTAEHRGIRLYLYWVVSARKFILAKIIYNIFLLIALGIITFLFLGLFIGFPEGGGDLYREYLLGFVVGCMGFATVLTLLGGIAAQAGNGPGLTAILGIPLLIPFILLLMRFCNNIWDQVPLVENGINLILLVGLNIGIMMLSYLLFPYLWTD